MYFTIFFSFDNPIILRVMRSFGLLEDFLQVVAGFVDTLHVFHEKFPLHKGSKQSFSQPVLAAEYGIDNPHAHNAIGDVTVLELLVSKMGLRQTDFLRHVKTV